MAQRRKPLDLIVGAKMKLTLAVKIHNKH